MNRIVISLFFLSMGLVAHPQADITIDSLKDVLKGDIHDTTRAKAYIDLATLIPDEDTWVRYNDMAYDLAVNKLPASSGQSHTVYLSVIANALANRGYYWDYHGDIGRALDDYYASVELYKDLDDTSGLASAYSNIGLIYSDNGDFEEAEDLLNKALDLKLKLSSKGDIAVTLINIGYVEESQGNVDEGERMYMRAAELAYLDKAWSHYATAINNLGTLNYRKGDYNKALEHIREALKYYRIMGDADGCGWALANIGENHSELGQVDSALYYFNRAYDVAEDLGHPELTSAIAMDLYSLHREQENYQDALQFFEVYEVMEDCLTNVEMQKSALKKKQAHDRKMDQLAHEKKLEKQRAINREKDKQRQQQIVFISSGLGLVLLFAVIIFQRLRITRKQKSIIETQQKRTESQKAIIQEKNTEIVDSINYAKRIQNAILPQKEEIDKHLSDYFILYKPKDIVAGDFYWLETSATPTPSSSAGASEDSSKGDTRGSTYIAAADCTGHGVPGAMVSVVCNNAMNRAVREFELVHPGEILDKTLELVTEQFEKSQDDVKDGMDVALIKITRTNDESTVSVEYAGAHNPLWIISVDGSLREIKASKQAVGKIDNPQPFENHVLEIDKGSMIYIFSDGFADQFGGPTLGGKKFKSSNFKKLLSSVAREPVAEQREKVERVFEDWRGDLEQLDDVCVIGIRV